jgi:ATP-dependent Clp protease protease subunit
MPSGIAPGVADRHVRLRDIPRRLRMFDPRLPKLVPLLDDEPDEPDTDEPGAARSVSLPVNELEARLLARRKVMVFGTINDRLARDVVGRLLALADESDKPIDVFVNSPGGHVESGDSIHDIIKFLRDAVPIRVIGTGWVASAGALIFLAGQAEKRFCLPNTRFLLHQPMGGVRGPATDIDIEAREIIKMRERINQIIADETGQPIEKVRKDTDRNYWMSAEEAVKYGMVFRIITSIAELE